MTHIVRTPAGAVRLLRIRPARYRCPYCGVEQTHPAGPAPRCIACLDRGRTVRLVEVRRGQ